MRTYCAKKPLSTMLATSKNVLFPGHNHRLTTGTDDLTIWLSPEHQIWLDSVREVYNFESVLCPISFHVTRNKLCLNQVHFILTPLSGMQRYKCFVSVSVLPSSSSSSAKNDAFLSWRSCALIPSPMARRWEVGIGWSPDFISSSST